jgi:hypothetical protein
VLLPVSLAAGLTAIAHHPAAAALAPLGRRLAGACQAGAPRVGAFEQAQRLRTARWCASGVDACRRWLLLLPPLPSLALLLALALPVAADAPGIPARTVAVSTMGATPLSSSCNVASLDGCPARRCCRSARVAASAGRRGASWCSKAHIMANTPLACTSGLGQRRAAHSRSVRSNQVREAGGGRPLRLSNISSPMACPTPT